MRLTASFCSLVARTSEEFLSAASTICVRSFEVYWRLQIFFLFGFPFFLLCVCSLFLLCVFICFCFIWFGLDLCVYSDMHRSVCFRLKLQFFIWLWRNVESQVSWFKESVLNSFYSRGCYKELRDLLISFFLQLFLDVSLTTVFPLLLCMQPCLCLSHGSGVGYFHPHSRARAHRDHVSSAWCLAEAPV